MFADLHIHSCLSPCGHEWMTPNNIAGMAKLKELDAIAIADHNCAKNLPAADAVCRAFGILLVPAIEITTREEVHLLGYFPSVEVAEEFSDWLYARLAEVRNVPEIFGEQQVMDEDDQVIATVDKLLISAVDASIDELVAEIHARGGAAVPAHINRGSSGVLGALGFLPDAPFDAVEVYRPLPCPDVSGRRVTHSSDAHHLEDISERDFYLHVEELSVAAVLRWLKGEKP